MFLFELLIYTIITAICLFLTISLMVLTISFIESRGCIFNSVVSFKEFNKIMDKIFSSDYKIVSTSRGFFPSIRIQIGKEYINVSDCGLDIKGVSDFSLPQVLRFYFKAFFALKKYEKLEDKRIKIILRKELGLEG